MPFQPPSPVSAGYPRRWLAVASSTNDVAREWAKKGAPDGAVVVADHQTRGRGRRGRNWMSTPGKALCASFVLRPDWPADDAKRLAVLGGWAVYQALQRVGVPDLRIKWPNDVLSSGRKISGVLVEPLIARGRIEFAILGIGVNVQQEALDFPEELRSRAASCRMLGGTCSVEMVLDYLVEALAESRREPYEGVEARWKAAGADREATLE